MILLSLNTIAQTCSTIFDDTQSNFTNSPQPDLNQPNNQSYCINLKFHFVRNDDGIFAGSSLIPTQAIIDQTVAFSNNALNVHQISVASKGFDYIDSSANYNINTTTSNSTGLSSLSSDPTALNIYVNRYSNSFTFGGVNGNKIFISQSNFINDLDNTVHEIGHALGLYHTFHGTNPTPSDTAGCYENLDGSNCLDCGDKVCDTPSTACNGSNGCTRDKTNFMDYSDSYFNLTADHFTAGQGLRMRNAIQIYHQNRISYLCRTIAGLDILCPNQTSAYSISTYTNTNPSIAWSVSSGLQIIGVSNTASVNVKALNTSNTNEYETLTLTINGYVLTKKIWIGSPRYTGFLPITGAFNWVCRGYSSNHNVSFPVNTTATSYRWEITLDNDGFGTGFNCNGVSNPYLAKFNNNGSSVTSVNPTATFLTSVPNASINWGRCSANYVLSIFAINDCGETEIGSKYVTVGSPVSNPCNNNTVITSNYRMIISPNPIRYHETVVNLTPNHLPCDEFEMKQEINYKEIYGENYSVRIFDMNGTEKFRGDFNLDDDEEYFKFDVGNINVVNDFYIFEIIYPDGYKERQHIRVQNN